MSDRRGLNRRIFWLYEGHGRGPWLFRLAILAFDMLTIGYFLVAPFAVRESPHIWFDYMIGAVIAIDLAARFYIARSKAKFARRLFNWADLIVVLTMFAPLFVENFAFLRILRAMRIVRAYSVLRRTSNASDYLQRHSKIIERVTNLIVFMFIMSSIIYTQQVQINVQINSFIDALYFTVTSLTTTGYGDILMVGDFGRILAIITMVLGITLFLNLLRAIVSPSDKVEYECPECGLSRHDPDAVHCKHCGAVVHIQTEGYQ